MSDAPLSDARVLCQGEVAHNLMRLLAEGASESEEQVRAAVYAGFAAISACGAAVYAGSAPMQTVQTTRCLSCMQRSC